METIIFTATNGVTPEPGVLVQLWLNDVTLTASGTTGVDGTLTLSAAPGNYEMEAAKPGRRIPPASITVVDTQGAMNHAISLSVVTLPIAQGGVPSVLRLYGHLLRPSGKPAGDTRVKISTLGYGSRSFIRPGSGSDSGVNPASLMVDASSREVRTDPTGYWEIDVIVDSLVRVEVADTKFSKLFRVPNDPRLTVLNIADARSDPGTGAEVGITSDTPGDPTTKGAS